MIYRDKVQLDGGDLIRANVRVASNITRFEQTGAMDKIGIQVSFPPSSTRPITSVAAVTWLGRTYATQGQPIPIMALGRLDHWEISAVSNTGA